ncbi:anaerobic C4-dicarboxylate transporter family protein, partial [Pantoea ananatis]
AVTIPATFMALFCSALFYLWWDRLRHTDQLEHQDDAVNTAQHSHSALHGRRSVLIFIVGLVTVLIYAIISSPKMEIITRPVLNSGQARIAVMLTVAMAIVMFCRVNVHTIPGSSVFKTGMTSCICILGVAWLGST